MQTAKVVGKIARMVLVSDLITEHKRVRYIIVPVELQRYLENQLSNNALLVDHLRFFVL